MIEGETMLSLIQNEIVKMMMSKKPYLILVLLVVFISLFAYGELYTYEKSMERLEGISSELSFNWENLARQQIKDMERRSSSAYISEEGKQAYAVEIEQLKYFIRNGINPITPSAAKFTGLFAEQGVVLLIPLLVIILASDLVSGEFGTRTIKILMTRAVPRWKILLSKLIALFSMITVIMLLMAVLGLGISWLFFRRMGFEEPVMTGFSLMNGNLNTDNVITVSRFTYMVLVFSLAWYVSLVIGAITFLVSVLVKSTPATIGIIMASLIGGQFLQVFLSEWEIVKYFYVSNLNLAYYLSGDYQFLEGMTFAFSASVLGGWG